MAATGTFTTDTIPPDEAIYALSLCSEVEVYEAPAADGTGGATAAFAVRAPASGSPQVVIPAGGRHVFRRAGGYRRNDFVGYISAASGSLTMAQVER